LFGGIQNLKKDKGRNDGRILDSCIFFLYFLLIGASLVLYLFPLLGVESARVLEMMNNDMT